MTQDKEPQPVQSFHYDVGTRRLMALLGDQSVLEFTLTPDLKINFRHMKPEQLRDDVVPQQPEVAARQELVDDAAKPTLEKQPSTTISGKIKGDVRQGRPDSRGNPTAWARVAAHEEGEETARMLSTTFHRHTARIALSLTPESPITMQGYLRPTPDPSKMDQFSCFNLVQYPGKPEKLSEAGQ